MTHFQSSSKRFNDFMILLHFTTFKNIIQNCQHFQFPSISAFFMNNWSVKETFLLEKILDFTLYGEIRL